jgi:hypothetical protein
VRSDRNRLWFSLKHYGMFLLKFGLADTELTCPMCPLRRLSRDPLDICCFKESTSSFARYACGLYKLLAFAFDLQEIAAIVVVCETPKKLGSLRNKRSL